MYCVFVKKANFEEMALNVFTLKTYSVFIDRYVYPGWALQTVYMSQHT